MWLSGWLLALGRRGGRANSGGWGASTSGIALTLRDLSCSGCVDTGPSTYARESGEVLISRLARRVAISCQLAKRANGILRALLRLRYCCGSGLHHDRRAERVSGRRAGCLRG